MGFKMQVRRGVESELPELNNGELGFAEDSRKLFIGSPTGNERIANYNDVTDYVNMTYKEISSLVRDVSYLNLIMGADERVDGGTTFGTNFTRSYNVEMKDAFAISALPATAGSTLFTVSSTHNFAIGDFVTVMDAVNMEESEVVAIDATAKTLTLMPLVNSYAKDFQITRSMIGEDGTFDKRRYVEKTITGTREDVGVGNILGEDARYYNGTGRAIAVMNNGIIVAASTRRSVTSAGDIIVVEALDLRDAEPAWKDVHLIQAPNNVTLHKPVVSHAAHDDDAVIVYEDRVTREYCILKLPVDKFYPGNKYADAYKFKVTDVETWCKDYTLTTNSRGGGTQAENDLDEYLFATSARASSSNSALNVYMASIVFNKDTGKFTHTMKKVTRSTTSIDSNYWTSMLDCSYGVKSPRGTHMVVFLNQKTNAIKLGYHTASATATKNITPTGTDKYRQAPTSIYVPPKDILDPDDHGEIHVMWEEQTTAYGMDIMHSVSRNKGETFSAPVNITKLNTSTHTAVMPQLTASADGTVHVVYTKRTTPTSGNGVTSIVTRNLTTKAETVYDASVGTLPNASAAFNPNIRISTPITIFYKESTNRTIVKGKFSYEVTYKHKVNHVRFRALKQGKELALWVLIDGNFTVEGKHRESVFTDRTVVLGETEMVYVHPEITTFDVTLTLTREDFGSGDTRHVKYISGGVA